MDKFVDAVTGALGRLDQVHIQALYTFLKARVQERYSADLVEALENLEKNPDSQQCIDDLSDQLLVSDADKDVQLDALVSTLLDALYPRQEVTQISIMGGHGTVLDDGPGPVSVGDSDEDDEELVIG